ncbi:MAG TPA: DUF4136 domain-containing protein [Candidatus Eisenbacteria bacterium]|nr:DUF4136 domain-containing protein [Candidatus Eisenbacteria bacterium]
MKVRLLAIFAFVLLSAAGLAAQDVRYDYAQDVNFSQFKTYKWVNIKNAEQVDEITARQITSAIDAELAKKGLTKTDSDSADLYLGYQTSIGTEKELNAYGSGWGYGPGWGGGWYGGMRMSTTTVSTSTIYTGQLDLDMYDAAKKELVWRGIVSKTIDTKAKPEKRQKNIQKSVAKLLKNYPPPPKKK